MTLNTFKKKSREIFKLAIPAIGEMVLYMLIWVLDTMMVGRYGGELAVSAVGFSSTIMYTFMNILIAMGLSVSITSIIARYMGAQNKEKASALANLGLQVGGIVSLALSTVFFVFSTEILALAGAQGEVLTLSSRYMKICAVGMFFNMITAIFNGIFRGTKNTKTPLYGAFILNIVNLTLDYGLIFGKLGLPELGVMGAGLATTTGNVAAFIFTLTQLHKLPFKISLKSKINYAYLKELIFFAIPSGLQEAAFSIVRLLGVMMVMKLGSLAFAANQIANTIESISFMPGWGFAISTVSLVGDSVGRGNMKDAKEYANVSVILASITMGIASLLFLFGSEELVTLFMKEGEVAVINLGALCLSIGAIQQIPMAIDMVLSGALKGRGDTKTPFKVVLLCNWGLRLPLMFYFLYLEKYPVTYFWWITTFQWTVEALIFIKIYRRRFYHNK